MFEQIQTLVSKRDDIARRLEIDRAVLERVPRTIAKREEQLKAIDRQLGELRAKIEGGLAKK